MKFSMLDMSTCHITKETNDLLLRNRIEDAVYYQKPMYGYFIHIPEDVYDFNHGDIPNDLFTCMLFAKDNDCEWINLDCDGTVYDALEKYNW